MACGYHHHHPWQGSRRRRQPPTASSLAMAAAVASPPATEVDQLTRIRVELATLDQISDSEKQGFLQLIGRYLSGTSETIHWEKNLKPPTDEVVVPYDNDQSG